MLAGHWSRDWADFQHNAPRPPSPRKCQSGHSGPPIDENEGNPAKKIRIIKKVFVLRQKCCNSTLQVKIMSSLIETKMT
jgi:hypothetical protein